MATDPDLDLLAGLVGDVDRFSRTFWGKAPMRGHTGLSLSAVLSTASIEEQLLSAARRPTFRLVKDGQVLDPKLSTRRTRLAGEVVDDVADLEHIASQLAGGATLVMQALQRTHLPVVDLCRQLERATSHAVQANAYLTPAGASGLRAHRDDHDVIVVQLEGSKAWEVGGLGAVELKVGDVLYMPAGTEHSASAQSEASLHLTIGILTTTWSSVVHRLLSSEPALGAPLPLGFARPEHADRTASELREVLTAVAAKMQAPPAAEVVAREARRATTRRRPLLTGHLDPLLRPESVGLSTLVRLRPDAPVELEDRSDRALLRASDRTITFPPVARASLALLLSGEPVEVRAMSGIDEESRLVVARRLLREGLLEIVGAEHP
jgi:bifunctional lysine-specific demethylase and histidyl-hydroxylase NO66